MKKTQYERVLSHLIHQGSLTRLEAMFNYNVQNLTAVIDVLRNRELIDIRTSIKEDPNGNSYASYSLIEKTWAKDWAKFQLTTFVNRRIAELQKAEDENPSPIQEVGFISRSVLNG